MPGRIFPDEPEEQYQTRLDSVRKDLLAKGYTEENATSLAVMFLETIDSFDAEVLAILTKT